MVKRVKLRSRAIGVDPGDPRKLAALMSQLTGELRAQLSRQDDCPSTFLTRVAEQVTSRRRVAR